MKHILEKYNVKKVLTQNSKMKKSSKNGVSIHNWTLPAFRSQTGIRTCPNAGLCSVGCYARSGTYMFSNVKKAHESKLALSQDENFADIMIEAIEKAAQNDTRKNSTTLIRIHDSGDFYSLDYTLSWFRVMSHFKNTPNVKFYAYTKQVEMFNNLKSNYSDSIPQNFTLIYSYGGKQDHMIQNETDRHSAVFETELELLNAGYVNASDDDLLALTPNPKVGLVYHGAKSYKNTKWEDVA